MLFPYKIWISTLRIKGLLSDGLQYILTGVLSTGGEQDRNSELHLCVNVRAVILLCLLGLSLAQCALGPLWFRAAAGPTLTVRAQHSSESPAIRIPQGNSGGLLCFLLWAWTLPAQCLSCWEKSSSLMGQNKIDFTQCPVGNSVCE